MAFAGSVAIVCLRRITADWGDKVPPKKYYWCRAWESNPQRGKSPADFKPAAYANFASPAPANAARKEYHALRWFPYSVAAATDEGSLAAGYTPTVRASPENLEDLRASRHHFVRCARS